MDEPLINYQDLLDRVKKAVPFFQGDDDQQIVISYRHISFQTIINIDRNESLHVFERFALWIRNLPTSLFEGKRE